MLLVKFLFALRHPFDVCLSCFQQHFTPNAEMAHFLTLEDTFSRYKEVMELFEHYREIYNLQMITIRYE